MPSTIRGSDNFDSAGGNACKAWVDFNGTGTIAIRAAYNVSSITDNGVGDYTVNFTSALADTNFAGVITPGGTSGVLAARGYEDATARTTSAWRIQATTTAALADAAYINASVFR